MYAAFNGHKEVLKLLLQSGTNNVDQPENDGKTALMYAAENGHQDIYELLLQSGADAQKQDRGGRTAQMYTNDFKAKDTKLILPIDQQPTVAAGASAHSQDTRDAEEDASALQGNIDVMGDS
jgi:hypothetical protein